MDQECGNQERVIPILDNGEMGKFKDLASILPPMGKGTKANSKDF